MMFAWRRQASVPVRDAVRQVGVRFAEMFDNNRALPPSDFVPFLQSAGMSHEPMANPTIEVWESKLRRHGLLWAGTMNTDYSGRHSRILEGMPGNGRTGGTIMKIIDPDGGRRYDATFEVFLKRYETAFTIDTSNYYQIRHW